MQKVSEIISQGFELEREILWAFYLSISYIGHQPLPGVCVELRVHDICYLLSHGQGTPHQGPRMLSQCSSSCRNLPQLFINCHELHTWDLVCRRLTSAILREYTKTPYAGNQTLMGHLFSGEFKSLFRPG
jgi:hypothetical protein